jgi:hypothetical protein
MLLLAPENLGSEGWGGSNPSGRAKKFIIAFRLDKRYLSS